MARAGRQTIDHEPVDLQAVAEDAWAVVETEGASLEVHASETLMADRTRLHQLFENLFRNAVEHAGPEVVVGVGTLADGGFYVEDDGVGVPEDDRSDVFEIGYSGDEEGSGLGLAICKRIADAHGWTITVTTAADGGARLEISNVEGEDP